MKSVSQFALPARAAERLFEIAAGMDAPHGFVSIGQLNYALLRGAHARGVSRRHQEACRRWPDHRKRVRNALYFTDKGKERLA